METPICEAKRKVNYREQTIGPSGAPKNACGTCPERLDAGDERDADHYCANIGFHPEHQVTLLGVCDAHPGLARKQRKQQS